MVSIFVMLTTRILNLECYTPRWKSLQTPLPAPAGTADRSQWEVTMESQFLSGPLLYLLIAGMWLKEGLKGLL